MEPSSLSQMDPKCLCGAPENPSASGVRSVRLLGAPACVAAIGGCHLRSDVAPVSPQPGTYCTPGSSSRLRICPGSPTLLMSHTQKMTVRVWHAGANGGGGGKWGDGWGPHPLPPTPMGWGHQSLGSLLRFGCGVGDAPVTTHAGPLSAPGTCQENVLTQDTS